MPSFTNQVANLVHVGPVADISVGTTRSLSATLSAQGQPVPTSVRALAMIDTGAAATVLSPSVVESLELRPVGVAQISTPSTTKPQWVHRYAVDLVFPNGENIHDVMALEAPLGGQRIQCLIGRDVLAHGLLVYLGHTNQFTLSF
jgi:predicted aspartyl protease